VAPTEQLMTDGDQPRRWSASSHEGRPSAPRIVHRTNFVGAISGVSSVISPAQGIAEHGGMERSKDRRRTTHVIRRTRFARFWMVPYHTGWHLAHHVDMGVPWRNLPRLHEELVTSTRSSFLDFS